MFTLPSPLHPIVVHLPVALVVLMPLVAVAALWAIRRWGRPERVWPAAVAGFALLAASALAALKSGEREEEVVESVVAESAIETHEEAAEAFLMASAVVLLVAAAGLVRGRLGSAARVTATLGTLVLLAAGYRVGKSGGALVYQEGAATAYGPNAAPARKDAAEDDTDEH